MGKGRWMVEFGDQIEARRALKEGLKGLEGKVQKLDRWSPKLGCLEEGRGVESVWVKIVGIPLQFLEKDLLRKIGDVCGGFLKVDEQSDFVSNGFGARLLVANDGGVRPSELEIGVGELSYKIQLWWELDPLFSGVVKFRREGGKEGSREVEGNGRPRARLRVGVKQKLRSAEKLGLADEALVARKKWGGLVIGSGVKGKSVDEESAADLSAASMREIDEGLEPNCGGKLMRAQKGKSPVAEGSGFEEEVGRVSKETADRSPKEVGQSRNKSSKVGWPRKAHSVSSVGRVTKGPKGGPVKKMAHSVGQSKSKAYWSELRPLDSGDHRAASLKLNGGAIAGEGGGLVSIADHSVGLVQSAGLQTNTGHDLSSPLIQWGKRNRKKGILREEEEDFNLVLQRGSLPECAKP